MRLPGAAVRVVGGTRPPKGPGPLLLIATPPERFEALRAADPAWAGLRPTLIELPWLHGGDAAGRARFAYALAPAPARHGSAGTTPRSGGRPPRPDVARRRAGRGLEAAASA